MKYISIRWNFFKSNLSVEVNTEKETDCGMYSVDVSEAVRTYGDMVYRLALVRTDQTADAEDIFSEVFLKLLQNARKIESEDHLKAWLLHVTIQSANKQHASLWKKRVRSLEDERIDSHGHNQEYEVHNDVLSAIHQLPASYREVIHLHYFEGYQIWEISKLLHKKEGTVKSLLSRGREKLTVLLKDG